MAYKRFVKDNKDTRHKLLGSLFAEAEKRGISEEALRNDIAPGVIGKRLSKANEVEIERVKEHITGRKSQRSLDPQTRMIFWLWGQLHKAGKIKEPSKLGLRHYVKRMTGSDVLEWLTKNQKSEVIEDMKKWLERR